MQLEKIGIDKLPKSPLFKKMIGPSFIMLGMGLGSGELILWPYLAANYGLGIIWAVVIGITFQFFINMEIERYTLINGESVFVGLARKLKTIAPVWFVLSTIIPWMWPGIILSSAIIFSRIFNIPNPNLIAIFMLVLVGLILTLGKVVYKTQEIFQKTLIYVGVPIILFLALRFSNWDNWQSLFAGFIGKGDDYWLIPATLPLITFLGAFAYSGAGGNLNLAQSFYIREKGYGMGKYGGKITSILTGKSEKLSLEGKTFTINQSNIQRFNNWWKKVNLEHLLVFWFTGAITIIFLSLLSFSTVYKNTGGAAGINFLFEEALVISKLSLPLLGPIFLALAGVMLFSTQLSVLDATSRIISENMVILNKKKFPVNKLPKIYYSFLWIQIVLSIIILSIGFSEPLQLVVIGAFLNAITMLVYSMAILWLNNSTLAKELRPKKYRVAIIGLAIIFFGIFSLITLFFRS